MTRFYEPDLGSELDSPFARDANNKLVRRGYWLDMNDRSLVMVMTQGIGAHLAPMHLVNSGQNSRNGVGIIQI